MKEEETAKAPPLHWPLHAGLSGDCLHRAAWVVETVGCEVGGVRRERRGRSGFSGPFKEGRWVIREGPMYSYIPLLWDRWDL